MGRYKIKKVKCEATDYGMFQGPIENPSAVAICYDYEGKEQWLYAVDIQGELSTYVMKEDFYYIFVGLNYDEDGVRGLESDTENEIGGVKPLGEYCDVVWDLYENKNLTEPAAAPCSLCRVDGDIKREYICKPLSGGTPQRDTG